MRRLIDANALYEKAYLPIGYSESAVYEMSVTLMDIDNAPTVDAVEVVHGRWEKAEYCGFVRCDQCKDVYIDESWLDDGRWKYCPNGGAKMDGEREDNG